MTTAGSPSSAAWEPIALRGRPFLRADRVERDLPDSAYIIAQRVGDRYEIGELLAVGEASLLLRARDTRTDRPVILKAARSDRLIALARDGAPADFLITELRRGRHLLQTERRLLVRLRNAGCNAVPAPLDYVYDRNPALEALGLDEFLVETEPYLVLEEIAGVNLDAILAREFPTGVPERQALEWIAPILSILAVLHEPWRLPSGRTWHCVYQDLKPANIVIDPLGRPVLLDFGGCQVVVDGVPVLEGSFTPGYAPPECLGREVRVLLPCADVYTVGSTLHHMLSGIDPRARRSGSAGIFLDASSLPQRVTPVARRLVHQCLASRPSERLADARQVIRALQSWGDA